jgi:hypothetical protein
MTDEYISPLPSGDSIKAMLAKSKLEAEQLQAFLDLIQRGWIPPHTRKTSAS